MDEVRVKESFEKLTNVDREHSKKKIRRTGRNRHSEPWPPQP